VLCLQKEKKKDREMLEEDEEGAFLRRVRETDDERRGEGRFSIDRASAVFHID